MSIKRLAIIAALSRYRHNNINITTSSSLDGARTTNSSTNLSLNGLSSFEPVLKKSKYYGGLGLFHQQNFRGNDDGVGAPKRINGNANFLLGGAMLSLVSIILCVVCYCCHRSIKKRTEAAYRQQRWLENDPNMEIYSVEQCYETSGVPDRELAVTSLNHEPPPSYDAVEAMEEETEQLHYYEHQQQSSPPPGYTRMSLNDVSINMIASGAMNMNGTTISIYELPKPTNSTANVILTMKMVNNAQSCCSLQRAELENLWNVAAAAKATAETSLAAAAALTAPEIEVPGARATARKSAQNSATIMPENDLNRHHFNQNLYARACPLCGNYCHVTSMPAESGCDNMSSSAAKTYVSARSDNNGNDALSGVISRCSESLDLTESEESIEQDICCYNCPRRQSQPSDCEKDDADRNNNINDHKEDNDSIDNNLNLQMTSLILVSSDGEQECRNSNERVNITTHSPSNTPGNTEAAIVTSVTSQQSQSESFSPSDNDIDSINDNGIIRLDMSKIIDSTGLTTYEAALKLESSGYV